MEGFPTQDMPRSNIPVSQQNTIDEELGIVKPLQVLSSEYLG
jgi:hypothetical protein